MPDVSEQSIEAALEGAFGEAPPAAKPAQAQAPAAAAPEVDEDAPEGDDVEAVDGDEPADDDEQEAKPAESDAATEPEFEIEVNGQREVVRGKDQIVELIQKGRDYSVKTEAIARARDSLLAQAQQQQVQAAFQREVFGDLTQIQALDAQLEAYNKIDWAAAFDADPFNALKLKEQRDQLREQRQTRAQEVTAKSEQYRASQAEAARRVLASEQGALLAKLPEWRNSDQATKERGNIAKLMAETYGYQMAEIESLVDHRHILVLRDAMKWRELQAKKPEQLKQVRSAPPVVKPGAVSPDKSRAESKDMLKQIRQAGRKSDHRTQEQLATKMFDRVFK